MIVQSNTLDLDSNLTLDIKIGRIPVKSYTNPYDDREVDWDGFLLLEVNGIQAREYMLPIGYRGLIHDILDHLWVSFHTDMCYAASVYALCEEIYAIGAFTNRVGSGYNGIELRSIIIDFLIHLADSEYILDELLDEFESSFQFTTFRELGDYSTLAYEYREFRCVMKDIFDTYTKEYIKAYLSRICKLVFRLFIRGRLDSEKLDSLLYPTEDLRGLSRALEDSIEQAFRGYEKIEGVITHLSYDFENRRFLVDVV